MIALKNSISMSFFCMLMLIPMLLSMISYTVYANSYTTIEVNICDKKYSLSVMSNSTILSIGTIPNGLKIIVNETPARILIYLSRELQVDNVKGDAFNYRLMETSSGRLMEIAVPRVSGLAEVEITFEAECFRIPPKVVSLGLILIIAIIAITIVLKKF